MARRVQAVSGRVVLILEGVKRWGHLGEAGIDADFVRRRVMMMLALDQKEGA